MQPESQKYLYDIQDACRKLEDFTRVRTLDDYVTNEMLRAAVERQFEIIGEALNQLSRIDSALVASIPDVRRIIAFRNILIHGYATIRHDIKTPNASQEAPTFITSFTAPDLFNWLYAALLQRNNDPPKSPFYRLLFS